MLAESLDQGYAKAPDVAGCGDGAVLQFWRIVQGSPCDTARAVANGPDRIARQFELIIDDQDVRRLQLAVRQVVSMQETQSVERGGEHFLHFVGGQRTLRQYLCERLLGAFHNDEEKS